MDDPDYGPPEFLCYQVIRAAHEIVGRDLPKTEFNKQCYLVYKELQEEEDVEAYLPVYWYEHGIMVDLEEILDDFLSLETKRWSSGRRGQNVIISDDWEAEEFDVEPSIARSIENKAIEVARRFKGAFDTSIVKDRTYEKYGNEFVQTLNETRYYIEELDDIDTIRKEEYVADIDVSFSELTGEEYSEEDVEIPDDLDEIEEDVIEFLDRLVETYPPGKYQAMKAQFRQWESISRQFAMNHMFSQLHNLTHEFWIRFSRGELRIEHNENIPTFKVRRWRRERSEHIEELEDELDRYRRILLNNRKESDELSAIADSFSEAVRDTYATLRENEQG